MYPREMKTGLYKDLYVIFIGAIPYSLQMETTQTCINWSMGKVWNIHTVEYSSLIKRNVVMMHNNLDKFQKHYVK